MIGGTNMCDERERERERDKKKRESEREIKRKTTSLINSIPFQFFSKSHARKRTYLSIPNIPSKQTK